MADHGLDPADCEAAFEDAVKALKVKWIHAEMRLISESQRSAGYDEMLELAKRHAELTEYLRRFRGAAPL